MDRTSLVQAMDVLYCICIALTIIVVCTCSFLQVHPSHYVEFQLKLAHSRLWRNITLTSIGDFFHVWNNPRYPRYCKDLCNLLQSPYLIKRLPELQKCIDWLYPNHDNSPYDPDDSMLNMLNTSNLTLIQAMIDTGAVAFFGAILAESNRDLDERLQYAYQLYRLYKAADKFAKPELMEKLLEDANLVQFYNNLSEEMLFPETSRTVAGSESDQSSDESDQSSDDESDQSSDDESDQSSEDEFEVVNPADVN